MEFKTHNEKEIDANGTYLQGYIHVPFSKLVKIFGEPKRVRGEGCKVDAEWQIEYPDGYVATIYNYKDGVNYLGENYGIHVEDITEWHIGGHNQIVVEYIQEDVYSD